MEVFTVKGLTLIELMISIAFLTIILSISIPELGYIIDRHQSNTAVSKLKNILNSARIKSLNNEISLTVCPLINNQCTNSWSNTIAVFRDIDTDQILDEEEDLFLSTSLYSSNGYWLKKRSNTPFIRFSPQGHAFSSATTFLYCPFSGNNSAAKQVIINFQGRIRLDNYLSSNGKPFSTLAPLSCL